jgi:hypothetical protein
VAGFEPAASHFQRGPSTWLTLHLDTVITNNKTFIVTPYCRILEFDQVRGLIPIVRRYCQHLIICNHRWNKNCTTDCRKKITIVARFQIWWRQSGSNRRPIACKAIALPAELYPHYQNHQKEDSNLLLVDQTNSIHAPFPENVLVVLIMVGLEGNDPSSTD